ncbi:MAG: response regulator [Phenylobacterium sp.]
MSAEISQPVQSLTDFLQRVLIVDPQPANAELVSTLMSQVARPRIWVATSGKRALTMAAKADPQMIFVELSSGSVDGLAFTRALRRSDLACRKAPVILSGGAAAADVLVAARDAGAHEFLPRPFTGRHLLQRLEAAALMERDWIEADCYVGPDRRRFNSGDYAGPQRRQDQAGEPGAFRRALTFLRPRRAA